MKRIQTKTAVAILIAAGSIAPAFAQSRGNGHGHEQQARPQQETRRSGGSEVRQSTGFSQSRSFSEARPQQRAFEQPRGFERPQSNFRGGNSLSGARNWQGDHRSWSERGGYRGYVIPQNRFYGAFGRENFFRIGRPAFYNGYPRFFYGGYSFMIMDQVPDYWGPDWYDSDDVSIDYSGDGYYMYNRRYPGAGIALNVGF